MIDISNLRTFGFESAVRGMRNPLESWEKSDSGFIEDTSGSDIFVIAQDDLKLASKLARLGGSHAKFRRMIHVQMDILAPLYWWKEFDTYKVGTTANSTSTMRGIMKNEFSIDDFSHEHLIKHHDTDKEYIPANSGLLTIIDILNHYRGLWVETKDKKYWWQIIQLLPSGYNQLRTIDLNYEVLANICRDRKDHKLDEWREFVSYVQNRVPYADELIFCKEKESKLFHDEIWIVSVGVDFNVDHEDKWVKGIFGTEEAARRFIEKDGYLIASLSDPKKFYDINGSNRFARIDKWSIDK